MFPRFLKITCAAVAMSILLLLQETYAQTAPVQNGTVSGQVLDDYSRPLKNVLVAYKGSSATAITNDDGRFTIATGLQGTLVHTAN